MYCVALAVGSVVGAVILSLLKKTRTENDQAILLLFKYKQLKAPIRHLPDGGLWRVRYR